MKIVKATTCATIFGLTSLVHGNSDADAAQMQTHRLIYRAAPVVRAAPVRPVVRMSFPVRTVRPAPPISRPTFNFHPTHMALGRYTPAPRMSYPMVGSHQQHTVVSGHVAGSLHLPHTVSLSHPPVPHPSPVQHGTPPRTAFQVQHGPAAGRTPNLQGHVVHPHPAVTHPTQIPHTLPGLATKGLAGSHSNMKPSSALHQREEGASAVPEAPSSAPDAYLPAEPTEQNDFFSQAGQKTGQQIANDLGLSQNDEQENTSQVAQYELDPADQKIVTDYVAGGQPSIAGVEQPSNVWSWSPSPSQPNGGRDQYMFGEAGEWTGAFLGAAAPAYVLPKKWRDTPLVKGALAVIAKKASQGGRAIGEAAGRAVDKHAEELNRYYRSEDDPRYGDLCGFLGGC